MYYKMCHLKYLVVGYVAAFSTWCGLTAKTEVPGTRHPVDLFLRGAAQGVPLAIVLPFTFELFPKKEPVEPRKGGLLNIVAYGKD